LINEKYETIQNDLIRQLKISDNRDNRTENVQKVEVPKIFSEGILGKTPKGSQIIRE
jgi:hypothetical protein